MPETDFEQIWIEKFSRSLDEVVGEKTRGKILKGNENFSSNSNQQEIIDWTIDTMKRLDALVDEKKRKQIMTECACQYPKSDLKDIREKYEETKDIDLVHKMLQEKFISFLNNSLKSNENLIKDILSRGWGLAGIKKGSTIIATKIPKSGNLIEYMKETDLDKKRTLYCHCPRIRDILKTKNKKLSSTYCYCGAGFYKGIWEEILQKPVQVDLLETVMKGDDVCKIAIHLPF